MADYARKTVADLKEILKSRGLSVAGKKEDLVGRLQEADEVAEVNGMTHCCEHYHDEQIADMPTEAEVAPPAPSTSAPPDQDGSTIAQESAPQAEPMATEQAPTDGNVVGESIEATTQPDYSLHLPTSTIDTEMEKRKARAARFGITPQEGDTPANGAAAADTTEQDRALARAQRFGLSASDTTTIGKLDGALSADGPKGRSRGGPKEGGQSNGGAFDDPGLIRRGGRFGRGGGRGRNRREGSAGARPTGVEKRGGGYNDMDRKAAEARKARFAQG